MRTFVLILVLLAICYSAMAQDAPQQATTQSWFGLSGLYVTPTARVIGKGNLALGYNETKHSEYLAGGRSYDRQVQTVATYGATDNLEIYASYIRNTFDVEWTFKPQLENHSIVGYGFKYRLVQEDPEGSRPDISIAVRDLGDQDRNVEPLKDVHNGRMAFLLASKRVKSDPETGRFVDLHAGLTYNYRGLSGTFGTELALSPSISFIGEGMWASPFVNFRGTYMHSGLTGTSDHPGRFIYCTGLRVYPDILPGTTLDLGFVGDGAFEFAFGMGWVHKIN